MKVKKIIISLFISLISVGILAGLGYQNENINYSKSKNIPTVSEKVSKKGEKLKNSGAIAKESIEKKSAEELFNEAQKERIETVTISAVGDVMSHMPQVYGAYTGEGYDYGPSFESIKYINDRVDISMANLETVLAGEEVGYSGFPYFNTPDAMAKALKDSGFDIISTANNHSLDQGKDGIIRTIDVLNSYELENIGTFKEKPSYTIKEVNGIKIGMLCYTYGLNGLDGRLSDEDRANMVALIDEEAIKRDIEYLNDKVDITLMYIHWGAEYYSYPFEKQIDLADKIFQWGGDIILGSHPHEVQKYELRDDGKYIIYSMGNFISNMREQWMQKPYVENGVIVELTLEKNFKENKTYVKEVNHIPTWVYMYHDGSTYKHEIVPIENGNIPEKYLALGEDFQNKALESYNETMDVLEGRR